MGSIFAALIPNYIGGIDNVILCSPTHVPFEGSRDKKSNSGESIATWQGKDIPFVKPDFSARKMTKYYYDKQAGLIFLLEKAVINDKIRPAKLIYLKICFANFWQRICMNRKDWQR